MISDALLFCQFYTPNFLPSPFSLLLQEVGEVVTLVHVVGMFAFLCVQLVDSAAMALFSKQQLTQHSPICLLVLLLQTIKLQEANTHIAMQNML